MTDSYGNLSQFEEFLLQLPDNDTPDLNPPNWYVPQSSCFGIILLMFSFHA